MHHQRAKRAASEAALKWASCTALHIAKHTQRTQRTHPCVEVRCQAVLRIISQLQRLCRAGQACSRGAAARS